MVVYMKAHGLETRCMEKDFSPGQMDGVIREDTSQTKNMDLELLHGQMVKHLKEAGLMENSMALESTQQ